MEKIEITEYGDYLFREIDSPNETVKAIVLDQKAFLKKDLRERITGSGVYVLISNGTVYVGESSNLKNRLSEHNRKKKFNEVAVVLTKPSSALTKSEIHRIEIYFIEFLKSKNYKVTNDQKGFYDSANSLSEHQEVKVKKYIEEALKLFNCDHIQNFFPEVQVVEETDMAEKSSSHIEAMRRINFTEIFNSEEVRAVLNVVPPPIPQEVVRKLNEAAILSWGSINPYDLLSPEAKRAVLSFKFPGLEPLEAEDDDTEK